VPHSKDNSANAKPTIVSSFAWDKDQKYLYCGDELGQITIWNLCSLVNVDGVHTGRLYKVNYFIVFSNNCKGKHKRK
jgi:hypothetical protein